MSQKTNKMEIYYIPNRQQQKEKEFFNYLIQNVPASVHIRRKYPLPSELLAKSINTADIISSLMQVKCISELKKNNCLKELNRLPKQIRIIKSLEDISVDITIKVKNKIHYIEFHESQHRIDSNKRIKYIYDCENNPIPVPRYLQRLLRDIWRWKFLPNYTIVWFDWFKSNNKFPVTELISDVNCEYSFQEKFRISNF
jgi:hypothetical protein